MRCCSLNSDRAEELILSAIRYKTKLRKSNKKQPRIPSVGDLEAASTADDDDDAEGEELERLVDDSGASEAFLVET